MESAPTPTEATFLKSLKPEDFATLVRQPESGGPVLTLLVPMEEKGRETRKNHIAFKNILSEAEELLANSDTDTGPLASRLKELEQLDDPTEEFWQHQSHGLAVTIDAGETHFWAVPFQFRPAVHLTSRPALGELLRLTDPRRLRFLVLDLSCTRLFQAGPQSVTELDLGEAPSGLDEAMRFDDPEKSLQQRSASTPSPGQEGSAMYHGHGVTGDEEKKIKIRRFFEMINHHLAPVLAADAIPLVLFGPASECGFYRQVNSYHGLEESEIHLNPSSLSDQELHEKLRGEVANRSVAAVQQAIETFQQAKATGQGSADLAELFSATVQGKLDTLMVTPGEPIYGVSHPESGQVEIHSERHSGDEDLLESLATATALQGGKVMFLEDSVDGLPDDARVAGVYRY